jgi:hypothetical protein
MMNDQALRDYFKFDEADLKANRNGQLTRKQKKNFGKKKKSAALWVIIAGLFFFGIASIFPIVFIPMAIASLKEHETGAAIGSFIPAIIWAVIWGAIGFAIIFSLFEPAEISVNLNNVVGPLQLKGERKSDANGQARGRTIYRLCIGDDEFMVSKDLSTSLIQGDTYAIYFDDKTKKILSMEWLAKA